MNPEAKIPLIVNPDAVFKDNKVYIEYEGDLCPVNQKYSSNFRKYISYRYAKFKEAVCVTAKSVMRGRNPLTGDLKCRIIFWHKRADIDSMVKGLFDGLNGVAFKDDGQISRLEIIRRKDGEKRAEIMIEKIL